MSYHFTPGFSWLLKNNKNQKHWALKQMHVSPFFPTDGEYILSYKKRKDTFSLIVRYLMLPEEGNPTDWFLQIFEDQKLWDQWNILGTYVVDGSLVKFNDYVVLK